MGRTARRRRVSLVVRDRAPVWNFLVLFAPPPPGHASCLYLYLSIFPNPSNQSVQLCAYITESEAIIVTVAISNRYRYKYIESPRPNQNRPSTGPLRNRNRRIGTILLRPRDGTVQIER